MSRTLIGLQIVFKQSSKEISFYKIRSHLILNPPPFSAGLGTGLGGVELSLNASYMVIRVVT